MFHGSLQMLLVVTLELIAAIYFGKLRHAMIAHDHVDFTFCRTLHQGIDAVALSAVSVATMLSMVSALLDASTHKFTRNT